MSFEVTWRKKEGVHEVYLACYDNIEPVHDMVISRFFSPFWLFKFVWGPYMAEFLFRALQWVFITLFFFSFMIGSSLDLVGCGTIKTHFCVCWCKDQTFAFSSLFSSNKNCSVISSLMWYYVSKCLGCPIVWP